MPPFPYIKKYYKRYAARVRVRQIKEPDFKKWKYQAMTKRDECTDGKITLSEFEEWMEDSFPNRKKEKLRKSYINYAIFYYFSGGNCSYHYFVCARNILI